MRCGRYVSVATRAVGSAEAEHSSATRGPFLMQSNLRAITAAAILLAGNGTVAVAVESTSAVRTRNTGDVACRTVYVDGVKIFYCEAGRPSLPVIVLWHGFPSSSFAFRDLIPRLSSHFHVLAPDYPGYGYSDAPAPESYGYTFDHLARTIDQFLGKVAMFAVSGRR